VDAPFKRVTSCLHTPRLAQKGNGGGYVFFAHEHVHHAAVNGLDKYSAFAAAATYQQQLLIGTGLHIY
jgi:hypothetical protein